MLKNFEKIEKEFQNFAWCIFLTGSVIYKSNYKSNLKYLFKIKILLLWNASNVDHFGHRGYARSVPFVLPKWQRLSSSSSCDSTQRSLVSMVTLVDVYGYLWRVWN